MRVIAPAELRLGRRSPAKLFFVPKPYRRHIHTEVANRVPRRSGIDPLVALTWLVLAPLATVAGWYGVFAAMRWLWRLL